MSRDTGNSLFPPLESHILAEGRGEEGPGPGLNHNLSPREMKSQSHLEALGGGGGVLNKGDGPHQRRGSEEWKGAWALSSFQAIDPPNREPFSLPLPLNK